ncbi:MAG: 23S rRNA (pseudouridine(1915)-N(3))-methyltransferase RlmH [Pseudomonadota bacterium]
MRLQIVAVGRMKPGPTADLFAHYAARIPPTARQVGISGLEVVERAESRAQTVEQRKQEEARALAERAQPEYARVALDENGALLSSAAFAEKLGQWRDSGAPGAAFFIGGADGLHADVSSGAALTLSLGRLTMPHQLARIVLAEQLYRAMTLLAGHPYHRH